MATLAVAALAIALFRWLRARICDSIHACLRADEPPRASPAAKPAVSHPPVTPPKPLARPTDPAWFPAAQGTPLAAFAEEAIAAARSRGFGVFGATSDSDAPTSEYADAQEGAPTGRAGRARDEVRERYASASTELAPASGRVAQVMELAREQERQRAATKTLETPPRPAHWL